MKPISETARETRAKASELAEKTAENARATADAAKARIQEGYGRARTATHDLADRTRVATSELADRTRVATSELAARGREQADAAREAAGHAYEKGKAQAKRANGKLKTLAEEQPLAVVAGAVAIGALIGSLLPKRKGDPDA
ncbi:MAG: hypothetical protein DI569_10640 [Sphingopyxis macrogoltabida]|uniref:DUF883 domain-containing protein n=1 Tax=Sphingopyxis macrogoltabida TaxID=33050 RepID=A0A2W5MVS1_SPHMC|nr:MAG: hypothetical protein DI569_10640 [Sphingopyxis macrogoltabida]